MNVTPLHVRTTSKIEKAYATVSYLALNGFGYVSDIDRAAHLALLVSAASLDLLPETPTFLTVGAQECGKSLVITSARIVADLDPHDDAHFPINVLSVIPQVAQAVTRAHFEIRLDARKITGTNSNPVGRLIDNKTRLQEALRAIIEFGSNHAPELRDETANWSKVVLTPLRRIDAGKGRTMADLAMKSFVNRSAAEVKRAA